ncbi:MAG: Ppx/GppA family phosphatase [bacterium]|nr:Ppx/GppA family phosphatase [bacterium]
MAGTEMVRIGAVDIGTNTVRLLVVEPDEGGLGEELAHYAIVTRLGQGVDEAGALHSDAIDRTVEVLRRYGTIMDRLGVARRRVIATSASRDASNASEFLSRASEAVGQRPEIISGSEEASLSFSGARVDREKGEPTLVIDLGGGSTEFVAGTDGPEYANSIDIGSVRVTERFATSVPVPLIDVARAREHVSTLFQEQLELPPVAEVIGVAGTYTTLCAIHLGLPEYDRVAVHGTVLSESVLADLVDLLGSMSVEEIAAIPSMHRGRAAVILAGAVVAQEALAVTGIAEIIVSENDILQGVALSIRD